FGSLNQYAIPLAAGVVARTAKASQQAAIYRPGQLAAGLGKVAPGVAELAADLLAAAGRCLLLLADARLVLLQGQLALTFTAQAFLFGLAGQFLFDGGQQVVKFFLLLLAAGQPLLAALLFFVQFGHQLAALLAQFGQLVP